MLSHRGDARKRLRMWSEAIIGQLSRNRFLVSRDFSTADSDYGRRLSGSSPLQTEDVSSQRSVQPICQFVFSFLCIAFVSRIASSPYTLREINRLVATSFRFKSSVWRPKVERIESCFLANHKQEARQRGLELTPTTCSISTQSQ